MLAPIRRKAGSTSLISESAMSSRPEGPWWTIPAGSIEGMASGTSVASSKPVSKWSTWRMPMTARPLRSSKTVSVISSNTVRAPSLAVRRSW